MLKTRLFVALGLAGRDAGGLTGRLRGPLDSPGRNVTFGGITALGRGEAVGRGTAGGWTGRIRMWGNGRVCFGFQNSFGGWRISC